MGPRLDLLTGPRDDQPRRRTLRATIDWSHDLLTQPEQTLFRRLAMFADGCALDATEAVGQAEPGALDSLLDRGPGAAPRRAPRGPRFWMVWSPWAGGSAAGGWPWPVRRLQALGASRLLLPGAGEPDGRRARPSEAGGRAGRGAGGRHRRPARCRGVGVGRRRHSGLVLARSLVAGACVLARRRAWGAGPGGRWTARWLWTTRRTAPGSGCCRPCGSIAYAQGDHLEAVTAWDEGRRRWPRSWGRDGALRDAAAAAAGTRPRPEGSWPRPGAAFRDLLDVALAVDNRGGTSWSRLSLGLGGGAEQAGTIGPTNS